jgi:hypothetical protein
MQTTILHSYDMPPIGYFPVPEEWIGSHIRLCHMYVTKSENPFSIYITLSSRISLFMPDTVIKQIGTDLLFMYPEGMWIPASEVPYLTLAISMEDDTEDIEWTIEWMTTDEPPQCWMYSSFTHQYLTRINQLFLHGQCTGLYLASNQPIDTLEFTIETADDESINYQFMTPCLIAFDSDWTGEFRIRYDSDDDDRFWIFMTLTEVELGKYTHIE